MLFTINASTLADTLKHVSKTCSQSTLPIHAGVKLSARDGMLTIQATNVNESVMCSLRCNVEDDGDTVLPGKLLADITKGLPDSSATFELEGPVAVIKCGKARYRLNAMDAADFPEFPEIEGTQQVTLNALTLTTLADRTCRVASKDPARPVIQGVLMTVDNNVLRLVGTDSYRLCVCDTSVDDGEFSAVIPAQSLRSALDMAAAEVTIIASDRQVRFESGNTVYVTRLLEGQFPNYKMLVSDDWSTRLTFDADEFTEALRRVSVTAKDNPTVMLHVDPSQMFTQLMCSSQTQGESTDIISGDVEGDAVSIGLNNRYLADALASCDGESFAEFDGSMKPALFKSYGDINTLTLLMPVRT